MTRAERMAWLADRLVLIVCIGGFALAMLMRW